MSGLQRLLENFERQVALPLAERLPPAQRVWFVVYAPEQERRLRFLLPEFQLRAEKHSKIWKELDLTDLVPKWVCEHEYHEAYLRDPTLLDEQTIQNALAERVMTQVTALQLRPNSLCARA
jgi:hypothetical protein